MTSVSPAMPSALSRAATRRWPVGTPERYPCALTHSTAYWKSVQTILMNGLDQQPQDTQRTLELPEHKNLRGVAYQQSSQIH